MKNKIIVLNVCKCKENEAGVLEGEIFDRSKRYNCLYHGYYQSFTEVTIEIDKNNKIVWSTIR